MGTLYVVPWYDCDLHCPHCEVGNTQSTTNEQFKHWLEELDKVEGHYPIILFGGEPTLYSQRFYEILSTGKINSVSTNLVNTTMRDFNMMSKFGCDVATSWNPHRFNKSTLQQWYASLSHGIHDYNLNITVLITLTKDLFEMDMNEVLNQLRVMRNCGCDKFLFEHYIGEEDLNKEADEWLVKFHDAYEHSDIHMANLIEEKLKNWNCNCTQTMTLEPTGRLRKGCPQRIDTNIPMECLTCEINHICQPCVLQKSCSYPKKLYHHLTTLND